MTRQEPILAWRSWRLGAGSGPQGTEPVLESCVYGDPWLPCAAFAAECTEHARPEPDCSCGIYAVACRPAALEWAEWAQSALPHAIVLGRVQLWGRILPYSAGYRAELAYPYELEVLPGNGLDEVEARRVERELRDLYLVDIAQGAA